MAEQAKQSQFILIDRHYLTRCGRQVSCLFVLDDDAISYYRAAVAVEGANVVYWVRHDGRVKDGEDSPGDIVSEVNPSSHFPPTGVTA